MFAHFDNKFQAKMLADLSLASMFFVSAAIAITVTVTGVPGEMEQKTVYPVLAKSVSRAQFILGKFARRNGHGRHRHARDVGGVRPSWNGGS